ncbi:hypothetical protein F2Q70_00003656 [Brassica cretica]|uniref:Exocyst component Exo84 C-terminal domain-containing protein n=1 Tax=Brassica cretica TaxID=69181 RepID=A0A8S9IVU0_BRACR|nr:hypothetical protein F2Q70_00003656 [Brassica cretica]
MAAKTAARRKSTPTKGNGVRVEEGLSLFKSDKFDADAYVQSKYSINEKDIKQLCSYLLDLNRASAEEMRRSVYANYPAFIRTSKEISDLEGELSSIRNLLSTQATLIHALANGVNIDDGDKPSDGSFGGNDLSDLEKWTAEYLDQLDALLAERRVDEALAAFDEGEVLISQANESHTLSSSLQFAISQRKRKLADQLAKAACQPSTRGGELRSAITALKRLGDGPRAHTVLLDAHFQRYQYNMQSLRPSSNGGAYTAALSQLSLKLPAIHWESLGKSQRLRAAAECAQIALSHCSLLEARGLSLCPVLLKHFKPVVEQALEANLKRIEDNTAAMAAADDWVLTYPPAGSRHASTAFQNKLTSSAHRFNLMVQDFFEDVGSLLSMQLGSKALEGLFRVFNSYVDVLIRALPGSIEEEEEVNFEGIGNKIVQMAETEAHQLALLANASLLADELLPRAATKLAPLDQTSHRTHGIRRPSDRQNRNPGRREWKRRLLSTVDKLKDVFCRQHALDLIFTEEGDSRLSADMYINMDENGDDVNWFPSLIFQELFAKFNRMASLAADMFVGRERFATSLLMRLTETVILWLSGDQSFWDDIEEGPRPLGPLGLRQLYLDMKFVTCFASQGRYPLRNLNRGTNEIISKALAAFTATGLDSELPKDDWFIEICLDGMERLSGKAEGNNGEVHSPTASVSNQEIKRAT